MTEMKRDANIAEMERTRSCRHGGDGDDDAENDRDDGSNFFGSKAKAISLSAIASL